MEGSAGVRVISKALAVYVVLLPFLLLVGRKCLHKP